jgi:predicted GIY-YIG superfamily endonuclease
MPRVAIGQVELAQRPHILYRFFDRTGVLLYVGITVDFAVRMATHAKEKDWWPQVERSATRVEYYDSRRAALDAERDAIKNEKPLHNDQHNEWVDDLSQNTIADLVLSAAVSVLGVDEVRLAEACAYSDEQSRLDEALRSWDARVGVGLAGSLHLVEALANDVLRFRRVAQLLIEAISPEMRLRAEEGSDHDHYCAGESDAPWEERIVHVLRYVSYELADHFGRERPRPRQLQDVA